MAGWRQQQEQTAQTMSRIQRSGVWLYCGIAIAQAWSKIDQSSAYTCDGYSERTSCACAYTQIALSNGFSAINESRPTPGLSFCKPGCDWLFTLSIDVLCCRLLAVSGTICTLVPRRLYTSQAQPLTVAEGSHSISPVAHGKLLNFVVRLWWWMLLVCPSATVLPEDWWSWVCAPKL